MIYDNVCMFIPESSNYGDVHVLHFARESYKGDTRTRTFAFYRIHIVTGGTAVLRVPSAEKQLKRGDVFFALPAVPFSLSDANDFSVSYIDCLGSQINAIVERMKIGIKKCVFNNFEQLLPLYKDGLSANEEVSDLSAKSVLYATFASIGARLLQTNSRKKESDVASQIKKYIDENFTTPELSLETLGKHFSYNPKYVSTLLKTQLNIHFKTYLNALRIQNACTLMQQGFSGVKNLASMCGFTDPLYFSKLFKTYVKMSPTQFLQELNQNDNKGDK